MNRTLINCISLDQERILVSPVGQHGGVPLIASVTFLSLLLCVCRTIRKKNKAYHDSSKEKEIVGINCVMK